MERPEQAHVLVTTTVGDANSPLSREVEGGIGIDNDTIAGTIMERQGEFLKMYPAFEGDLPAWGLWVWLTLHLNASPSGSVFISLAQLSKQTGFGKRKIHEILSRIKKMNLFSCDFHRNKGLIISYIGTQSDQMIRQSDHKARLDAQSDQMIRLLDQNVQSLTSTDPLRIYGSYKPSTSFHLSNVDLDLDLRLSSKTTTKLQSKSKPTRARNKDKKQKQQELIPHSSADLAKPVEEKSLGSRVWDAYAEAYERRYGFKPPSSARCYGQAKYLGQWLGEEAIPVVQFYLQHTDQIFVKNKHPFNMVITSYQRVHADWKHGSSLSQADAQFVEKRAATRKWMDIIKDSD